MRNRFIGKLKLSGMAALLAAAAAAALAASVIDADFMQRIEDATKSVDSSVMQKDGKAAAAEAKEIVEMLGQVEAYYTQKGDAADAVAFARKSKAFAVEIEKSVAANDFEAASNAVGLLARSCKGCHEVYKK